jgi:hypothetical protein
MSQAASLFLIIFHELTQSGTSPIKNSHSSGWGWGGRRVVTMTTTLEY